MPPGRKQPDSFGEEHADFVPALIAPSREEAELYCELLNDHDIPAMIGGEDIKAEPNEEEGELLCRRIARGVPVLVPEALLDEASEIIADRENIEDFRVVEEDEEDEDEQEQFGFAEPLDVDIGGDLDEDDEEEDLFTDEDDLEELDEEEGP